MSWAKVTSKWKDGEVNAGLEELHTIRLHDEDLPEASHHNLLKAGFISHALYLGTKDKCGRPVAWCPEPITMSITENC